MSLFGVTLAKMKNENLSLLAVICNSNCLISWIKDKLDCPCDENSRGCQSLLPSRVDLKEWSSQGSFPSWVLRTFSLVNKKEMNNRDDTILFLLLNSIA